MQERRVDLVLSLEDGSILHIEFQSTNDRNMAYRMVEYWPLIKRRFRRPLRQVVLYVGQARPAIANRLEEDDLRFSYGVMDIREIGADVLMRLAIMATLPWPCSLAVGICGCGRFSSKRRS